MINTTHVFKNISDLERSSIISALDRHIQSLGNRTSGKDQAAYNRGVTLFAKNKFESADYIFTEEEADRLCIAIGLFIEDLITHKIGSYIQDEIDAIFIPLKKTFRVFEDFLHDDN